MESKEVLEFIKNHKWYRQATNSKAYFIVRPCMGAADGIAVTRSFCTISKSRYFEGFYVEDELERRAEGIVEKQKKEITHIDGIFSRVQQHMDSICKVQNRLTGIKNADFEQVKEVLDELDGLNYHFWFDAFTCDVFDPKGEEILEREIKKSDIVLGAYELSTLLRPEKLNYAQKERLELLGMALEIKEGRYGVNDKKIEDALEKHAKEYYYVDNSWESTRVLKADDFKNKLEEILADNSVEEIKERIRDISDGWERRHRKIIERYGIEGELLNVIYLFRQLFFFREERKRAVLIANHLYDQLFMRLSSLLNIEFEELRTLTVRDLEHGPVTSHYRKLIKERKDLLMVSGGHEHLLSGQDAKEVYKELHASLGHEGEEIRGNVASRGKATGHAMVVMGEAHFGKFDKGQILVAPMTRPEYVPLMRKALAVITDEGGLTCHAAIVSRELGIPCIVGTRVATKVLKDGDLVEVDAENGIIKRLG